MKSNSNENRSVAVTDYTYPDLAPERAILEPLGFRFVTGQCRSEREVAELCGNADAIMTQYAPITAAVISQLQSCKIIVRYGIGVDNVDIDAAAAAGIAVVNVPDYGISEVADHTFALLLSAVRKIPEIVGQVRSGIWDNAPCRPIAGLSGRTLGLAGFGNIARAVARRAMAFDLQVIACDPFVKPEIFTQYGVRRVEWPQLLQESDLLSVHLPLTPDTRHVLNETAFTRMKPHALLINTSRGAVIETDALVHALRSGTIAGAALDVLEEEPMPPAHPLLGMKQCIVTSHCAWYSEDSMIRLQQYAAMEIGRLFTGEQPRHIVNGIAVSLQQPSDTS